MGSVLVEAEELVLPQSGATADPRPGPAPEEAPGAHAGTASLARMLAQLAEASADALGGVDDDATEADLIDQIGLLERLRGAVAATQAAAMVRLARARVARERAEGRRPGTLGRGLAEEIGLACRLSPTVAARRLGAARALWFDLPHTYAALATGRLCERVANAVVSETRHLDPVRRRDVDRTLHAQPDQPESEEQPEASWQGLTSMGVRQALAATAKAAYQADPRAYVDRGRTERDDRHVTLRPAPDTMSWLSGYLPVEQGVACLAALKAHTDTAVAAGDDRTRGQIMADTLVERVTGQTCASDVAVEIQLIVPAATTSDHRAAAPARDTAAADTDEGDDGVDVPADAGADAEFAVLTGAGAVPMVFARELVDASAGAKHVRTVQRSPEGNLVALGSRRRFTGALAQLLLVRDQTCREPFCDAPVRHLDHVQRHADGGATTLENGRGLCARHNLTREHPGWHARVVHDGQGVQPHTVVTTTPTGHTYVSRAPDPP